VTSVSVRQDTDTLPATRDYRRDRYEARGVLWHESKLDRVKGCGRRSIAPDGAVTIRASGAGATRSAGYGGVAHCGSVWACPVCSATVSHSRRDEVGQALASWHADRSHSVAMVTLTMRHHQGQRLKTLWDGVAYAWHKVTSGRAWIAFKERYGVVGWLRVVEVTQGENGWHVHVHALVFCERRLNRSTADQMGCEMFTPWRDALVRKEFAAPLCRSGGLEAHVVTGDSSSELGGYFTKATYELTGASGKQGHAGHRSPFQILSDVVTIGDADDLALWHEYERASVGRRQLTWSKGLRALLLAEVERTDQEIVEEDDGGQVLVEIRKTGWRSVLARPWLYVALLEAAEADEDGQALKALLGAQKIRWWPPGVSPVTKPRAG
jgi:hypothetical protein